jgi:hypothetical protein
MSIKYLLFRGDRVVGWTDQERGLTGIHVEYGLRDGKGLLHTSGIARLELRAATVRRMLKCLSTGIRKTARAGQKPQIKPAQIFPPYPVWSKD